MNALRHGAVHGWFAPIPKFQKIPVAPIDSGEQELPIATFIPWSTRTYPEDHKFTSRTHIRRMGANGKGCDWVRIARKMLPIFTVFFIKYIINYGRKRG